MERTDHSHAQSTSSRWGPRSLCPRLLGHTISQVAIKPRDRGPPASPMRVSHVVSGTRPVTAELALLFGRALRQTPQYWLNLQATHDLKIAQQALSKQLKEVAALTPA